MRRTPFFLLLILIASTTRNLRADGCTTQSTMPVTVRDGIASAALGLTQKVESGAIAQIRAQTIPQYATDFGGIEAAVHTASPHLAGAKFSVESVWLLDATNLKPSADGALPDGQFFCTLNRSAAQVSFLIPALPAGRYAFALVNSAAASPWQMAFILQEIAGAWRLAGFFPRATTAGGHDGLWYWTAARQFAAKKQSMNAWIYFQQASALLRPVSFFSSNHLDQLNEEMAKAAPSALSQGISNDVPLALKGASGTDLRITSIGTDDSLGTQPVDLALHFKVDAALDATAGRARNREAAMAFVHAYPEVRDTFHGVWVLDDTMNQAGNTPFASEEPMSNLP
ncbi:hypothetical protein [Terriglobus saanensis]|uniref:Uncharacterized protein n=1 Tax=Terriglobus saanensis (strain ATCC BAA-1853 / DSM 23119 / SP1PR4) TaxID=401053 RepID=E8V4V4_TERSS|nr:hypothetical protein [Terriglobus saanensis]ADV82582.1 hypothetical protein AciPR4_1776 [Terriglobus saanensis SP1PR4]